MHHELAAFQGTWRIRSLEMDGNSLPAMALTLARVVIEGDNFTTTGMGATYSGTLAFDSSCTPKTLDMSFTTGPEVGNTSLAIYEINGDEWKLCLTLAQAARPTRFATAPGSGHVLEVLVREDAKPDQAQPKPSPGVESPPTDDPGVSRFEGNWRGVSIVLNGQPLPPGFAEQSTRVVAGDTTTVTVSGNLAFQATFTCDPSTSPPSIDFHPSVGAALGKLQQGIYQFEGDQLTICYSSPGKPRPETFESQPNDGRTLSVWKKIG